VTVSRLAAMIAFALGLAGCEIAFPITIDSSEAGDAEESDGSDGSDEGGDAKSKKTDAGSAHDASLEP
jgi:hypothetical protein